MAETTHEIEGILHYSSAKARLVEDVMTGVKYWIPKRQIVDFNVSNLEKGYYLFVVWDWWWKKKDNFIAGEKE